MIFIFKKSEIHLDCFTYNQAAYNLFKIEKSYKFIPEWWKQMSTTYKYENDIHETPTIKKCPGFVELYKQGFVLPLWSDFILEIEDSNSGNLQWRWADLETEMLLHDEESRGTFLNYPWRNLKINAPWLIKSKEDIPFLYTKLDWNYTNPEEIIIPNGIVNFKYNHAVSINLFAKHADKKQRLEFDAGHPIAQLIPITEKRIVLHHHFIDKNTFKTIYFPYGKFKFVNNFNSIKKFLNKK